MADKREEHLSRAALRGTTESKHFVDYGVNASELLDRQFGKCAYCEIDVRSEALPVEHYRPKGSVSQVDWAGLEVARKADVASRLDDARFGRGLPPFQRERVRWSTHKKGYWWLAWTWENQVMACGGCNTGLKGIRFPLRPGSTPLGEGEQPPGLEHALLIDPTSVDPMDHIVFESQGGVWLPAPRDESPQGDWSIHVFDLKSTGLREKYQREVRVIAGIARRLDEMIAANADPQACAAEWRFVIGEVLDPSHQFLALKHDWLASRYPPQLLQSWNVEPLRRPELCLPGVSRSPTPRPVIPERQGFDSLPTDLQRLARVTRHFQARSDTESRPDQLLLEELVRRIRAAVPGITTAALATMLNRQESTIPSR